jgi:putative transposase
LSIKRQCELLEISRAGYYYEPKPTSSEDLRLINKVDEIYTEYPFFGTRRMAGYLQKDGYIIGRKKVRSIYEILGLEAIYPKPDLSRANEQNKKYPYLLRDVEIVRCDQVWSSDITYIRLCGGYVYLMVIMDWFSRYVLDWELSVSLESDFCIKALSRLLRQRTCEIFNTRCSSFFSCHA